VGATVLLFKYGWKMMIRDLRFILKTRLEGVTGIPEQARDIQTDMLAADGDR